MNFCKSAHEGCSSVRSRYPVVNVASRRSLGQPDITSHAPQGRSYGSETTHMRSVRAPRPRPIDAWRRRAAPTMDMPDLKDRRAAAIGRCRVRRPPALGYDRAAGGR